MAEWSKAHDWKSCVRLKRTESSNLSLSAITNPALCGVLLYVDREGKELSYKSSELKCSLAFVNER